jgi:hypothetical protein
MVCNFDLVSTSVERVRMVLMRVVAVWFPRSRILAIFSYLRTRLISLSMSLETRI